MKRFGIAMIAVGISFILFVFGCSEPLVEPTPNIDATVEARIKLETAIQPPSLQPTAMPGLDAIIEAKVLEAIKLRPTPTPYPTYTPFPTHTPQPEPTSTPIPIPTSTPTPAPTATAMPTPTPTVADIMMDTLSVELLSKTLKPKDTSRRQYSDQMHFNLRFTNSGLKDIRAFTGALVFADIFSRPFLNVGLTIDDPLLAKTSQDDDGYYLELNQYMDKHNQLKNSSMADLIVSFDIESILFTDGTQLGSVSD